MQPARTALIVDHNEPIRVLLTAFLTRAGFAVDSADSVADALAKLRSADFDVMIIDPWADSTGCISRVAADFPEILPRTIVIGARPFPPVAEPVHAVFEKPFDLESLLDAALGCPQPGNLHEA